jgi:NTP pyrophosphatase (non-canonical NTP hydrolase)
MERPVAERIKPATIAKIETERARQEKLWGSDDQKDPADWVVILAEELGEVSNEVQKLSYFKMRNELVQVAAVAIAAIEQLERDYEL